MSEFNSNDHYIYYCGQESVRQNGVALTVNKRVQDVVFGCNLKNDRMSSVCFQGKSFNSTNLDGDCSYKIKRSLVKAMVFPVVMYGCESWTIKIAECQRIDAFELWCWRRLLRVPWTARRSNQSILKGISPGRSLEGLMLKLKLPYFGHLMRRADSLENP